MNVSMKYYRGDSYGPGGKVKYFCKLCEEEGGTLMTSTEIQMVQHIQKVHQLNLVVDPEDQNQLIVEEKIEGNDDIDENKNYSNTEFSQNDTFYPCDLCPDIFLTRSHLESHTLSHRKQEEDDKKTVIKRRTNFKGKIISKPREKRIVAEYKCPICPKSYPNKEKNSHQTLKNHVLSHFYRDVSFQNLPTTQPFECLICNKAHRDRISLIRHFAFGHQGIL